MKNRKPRKQFYTRIKEGRELLGLTQKQAAKLIGISRESYNRIENGKVRPRSGTLEIICDKLNVCIQLM